MRYKKSGVLLLIALLLLAACKRNEAVFQNEYGVFIGCEANELLTKTKGYEVAVIEGQGIDASLLQKLHESSECIYAYVNVGAIENYREYYDAFKYLAVAPYENWPDEEWIDVTSLEWQEFVVYELIASYAEVGFDGVFLDNFDVYDISPQDEVYSALVSILKKIKELNMKIIVNGASNFNTKLIQNSENIKLVDGINQECVYTRVVDYELGSFAKANEEAKEYYENYLNQIASEGIKVYTIEYSQNSSLSKRAKAYAVSHNYTSYISHSLSLE